MVAESREKGDQLGVSVDLTPAQWVRTIGAAGALFGAGFPVASELTGRRGTVVGAVYGVAAYAGSELLFRVVASARTRQWLNEPRRAVPGMAAFGAAVGLIDSLT
jgi:hypothetical protein